MSIIRLEESRELKKEGVRLGRDGISSRALKLIDDFIAENPGNYKEVTKLIGRFHALYIATIPNDYWREIANRGYRREYCELKNYNKT